MQGPIQIPSKSETMYPAEFGTRLGCVSLHEPVAPLYLPCDLPALHYVVNSLRLRQSPSFSSSLHSSFVFNQWTALLSTDLFSIFGLMFHFSNPIFPLSLRPPFCLLHFVQKPHGSGLEHRFWNVFTCRFTRSIPEFELKTHGYTMSFHLAL